MITSRDVARLAGVSQPTVSRALRDDPKVSEATKQRVREAALALGYAPNAIGRALSVGRSTRVGLVVTDLENQFYAHVIAPMHHELERLGYELVLITESSESAPVAEHVTAHGLCGVVLATTTVESIVPVRLRDRGVPFVYFNRTSQSVQADSVTVDPENGVRELLRDAIGKGHRRIGAIFGPRNTSTGEQRENTVRAVLDEHGLALAHRDVRHGPFDFRTGDEGLRELLDRADPPTLVLCGNDVVALGALNAAAELGVGVPDDVSIAGFDDLPTSRWALIRLSTVAYDLDEMSREAARLIVARVEQPDAPQAQPVYPTRYVARATIAAPRA
ncbi:LacI family transcriptional regulator [Pseudonocardia hierapolitana]|uniref:LacI family transcriptional regulator n=1 Tax=Pseudonocardia hierapolitana TaxID=1128676 RepID=A0A561SY13_9PSEU|nr:LacI family DNA-binding transcriptional regulator [Pseudonocardia hierapolitana]TWF79760.1 LacI family transcriptional regulator [Pseudonocardia hierapolitana]